MSTQYWCKVFRSPPISKKNHIIAYEPMILSNSTGLVHHMFLYECDAPSGFLDSYASPHHNGAPCYSHEMPGDWENCVTPVSTEYNHFINFDTNRSVSMANRDLSRESRVTENFAIAVKLERSIEAREKF